MSKTVLVTGATGKQGKALIDAILKSPQAESFSILAVTRDPSSASAQKLSSKSKNIKVIKGDFNDTSALFKTAEAAAKPNPIWGVFSVQAVEKDASREEQYGKAMVDASIAAGVQHFVYSSVDRGGDEASWTQPTPIPHFASKHNIEQHLREKAGGAMGWTILRPVAFMENFMPGMAFRVTATIFKNNLGDKSVQLIAVKDIGSAAAQVLLDPAKYNKKAVGLAGDDLNPDGIQDAVAKHTGSRPGYVFSMMGSVVQRLLGKDLSIMFRWFGSDGYGVKIDELKRDFKVTDFQTWLASDSDFPAKASKA